MPKTDPRFDVYIANAQPFARPIIRRLRKLVHQACPEATETIKWRHPSFEYHGLLVGIAAFKTYCAFVFWKGALIRDKKTGRTLHDDSSWAARISSVDDLPSDRAIVGYIREAARLNANGVSVPRVAKAPKPAVKTPTDLTAALRSNARARATYGAFSPSARVRSQGRG